VGNPRFWPRFLSISSPVPPFCLHLSFRVSALCAFFLFVCLLLSLPVSSSIFPLVLPRALENYDVKERASRTYRYEFPSSDSKNNNRDDKACILKCYSLARILHPWNLLGRRREKSRMLKRNTCIAILGAFESLRAPRNRFSFKLSLRESGLIDTYLHDEPYFIAVGLPRGSSAIYPVKVREIRVTGEITKHTVLLYDLTLRPRRELLDLDGDFLVP